MSCSNLYKLICFWKNASKCKPTDYHLLNWMKMHFHWQQAFQAFHIKKACFNHIQAHWISLHMECIQKPFHSSTLKLVFKRSMWHITRTHSCESERRWQRFVHRGRPHVHPVRLLCLLRVGHNVPECRTNPCQQLIDICKRALEHLGCSIMKSDSLPRFALENSTAVEPAIGSRFISIDMRSVVMRARFASLTITPMQWHRGRLQGRPWAPAHRNRGHGRL